MSSLARRLQIRMMQRAGYSREKWIIARGLDGQPQPMAVRRGGEITDPSDNPIGRHWPRRIAPAKGEAPSSTKAALKAAAAKRKPKRAPRGRRRGKHSAAWIERRKEAKA